jgi:cytochrome c
MKKPALLIMVLVICFFVSKNVFGQSATKEECETKCKEAAQLVSDKGVDEAVKVINDKNGPFVWKDTYVWLNDLDGNMLAHPIKPDMIGKNWMDLKDKEGKLFFKELIETAKSKGSGWVSYKWPKPGEEALSEKITYCYRVPGTNLMTAAGIYK